MSKGTKKVSGVMAVVVVLLAWYAISKHSGTEHPINFQEPGAVWKVYKTAVDSGERKLVLEVKNEPGPIVSTALLPQGGTIKTSPFLSATSYDPAEEDALGKLLDKAKTFEEFMVLLQNNGYILEKVLK